MMNGTWFSAERFCSFYSCQWLMYFIFCFLYCHLSSHPQAGGVSPGTHSFPPPLPMRGLQPAVLQLMPDLGRLRVAQLDGVPGEHPSCNAELS